MLIIGLINQVNKNQIIKFLREVELKEVELKEVELKEVELEKNNKEL